MAVKTYTVNYNIVTNAAVAAEGFTRLATSAQEMVAPFKSISTSLTDLSRSVKILKENSAISFTANIQTAEFDAKLKTMVRAVQTASTEMAAAINNALRGDGRAIQGVREAANKALSKSDIRSALTTKQARLKEIVGTKSKGKTGRTVYDKNGLIHQARAMVKNTNLSPSELSKAQSTLSALEQERIALKAETKELQKQLDQLAKPVTAPKSAPVASSSPTTNVTPATIQAWQKYFGNAKNKSLTVQINGNASGPTGALTVIGDIQRKIKEIKGEIPILPKVDEAALATVKEKLSALSKLGAVTVKPVMQNKTGKDEQSKVGGGIAGAATGKGKKTGSAKKGKPLTSNQQQTIDLIGKVKKVELPQKTVSLPVNIKILNKQVNEALKNITPKTLPIRVKFGWEKGAVGKQEQIKGLTNSIPPINLVLNTTEAKAALDEFVALIKAATPQNIALTATGKTPSATKPVSAATTTASGGSVQKSARRFGTTGHQPLYKSNAPSGFAGKGANQVFFGNKMPSANLAPEGYHWEETNNLLGHLTPSQRKGYQSALAAKEAATKASGIMSERLATMQKAAQKSASRVARGQVMLNSQPWALEALAEKKHAAEAKLAQSRATLSKIQEKYKASPTEARLMQMRAATQEFAKVHQSIARINGEMRYWENLPATVANANSANVQIQQNLAAQNAKMAQMQPRWNTAMASPGMYSNGYKLAPNNPQPPKPPKATKSSASSASSKPHVIVRDPAAHVSAYDRFRKWGFPLTGATSFGSRTPMAVDMAKGMGVMFAIGGAMSAVGSSFSQAMQYQNTMKSTEAILKNSTDNYSPQAFANMEHIIRDVGMKTKFSAPEVASAARFLGMAGFDIDAINASIRTIADMALVGDFDLGETADKMTNIMTTFGYDSKTLKAHPEKVREFGNIMASTASRTNTDLMMLAESAKYGGGVAYMYGRNDPNLFAETMALFGVMGNAGIQGSSAGTALRMMYQNIFKPNKNQQKVIDNLEKLGVKITNEDGSKNSMASIISQIAEKVDEKDLSSVIGTLFRITAQPGANAAIMAATSQNAAQLAEMAQEDGSNLQDAAQAVNAVTSQMMSKTGLSTLANLIEANKVAAGSNLLRAQAEPKQNTIEGLWAQVTSTFTEGIVKAFENRTGGFEEMLIKLRDYLAKPETVHMIQNLLDLIIEVGKALAWFVKLWASLYNMAPGLIATWIKWQMIFTQAGSLIAPFIQLSSVFNRLGCSLFALAGMSNTAAASMTRAAAAGRAHAASVAGLPLFFATGPNGTKKIYGAAAWRANKAIHRTNPQSAMNKTADAIWYGTMMMPMLSQQKVAGATYNREAMAGRLRKLNNATTEHYAAVRERYDRIYGWNRMRRALNSGRQMGSFANILNTASWAPLLLSFKSTLIGVFSGLAKVIGAIVSPIGLTVGAIGALATGIWMLGKRATGTTEAQEIARQRLAELTARSHQSIIENTKWYRDWLEEFQHPVNISLPGKSQAQRDYENNAKVFQDSFSNIFQNDGKDASPQSVEEGKKSWQNEVDNNPIFKSAIGPNYSKFVGDDIEEGFANSIGDDFITLTKSFWLIDEWRTQYINKRQGLGALMAWGATSPAIQAAAKQITELKKQQLGGKLSSKDFLSQAQNIRNKAVNWANLGNYKKAVDLEYDEFKNISNPTLYQEYYIGGYNFLTDLMNGGNGTITAQLIAEEKLRKGIFDTYQERYAAIVQMVGSLNLSLTNLGEDANETLANLTIAPPPDGNLAAALTKAVSSRLNGFKMMLSQIDVALAGMYDQFAQLGLVENDLEQKRQFIYSGTKHSYLGDNSAADAYHNLTDNSWIKFLKSQNVSLEEFKQFISNQDGVLNVGGRKVHAAQVRVSIRKDYAELAAKGKIPGYTSTVAAPPNPEGGSDNNPYTPSQDPYASSYSRDVAKPTQVVFNIGSVANFDKTTVGANATDQDIAYAMEDKIAQTIYRLFAEAANQAQMQSNWS